MKIWLACLFINVLFLLAHVGRSPAEAYPSGPGGCSALAGHGAGSYAYGTWKLEHDGDSNSVTPNTRVKLRLYAEGPDGFRGFILKTSAGTLAVKDATNTQTVSACDGALGHRSSVDKSQVEAYLDLPSTTGTVTVTAEIVESESFVSLLTLDIEVVEAWTQIGDDIDGEGMSGLSVSMSADGTRVAIGAPYGSVDGAEAGHVRVFSESGGTWTQLGDDIDGEATGDRSGWSVSLSSDGTRVAIGATGHDGDVGHVRVYSESGRTWTQIGDDIDGEAMGDRSGRLVSLSSDGMRVAISARYNDGDSGDVNDNRGHVRVFAESGGTWTQIGADIDGEATGDQSGRSMSMSSDGTRVAIGATGNDGDSGDSADARGHVRVYAESGATWTQVGDDIDGEAAGDGCGRSVSLSSDGTRVAIGCDNADYDTGLVRVFSESGGTWTQVGADINGEAAGDESGKSVSISSDGTRVVIGAPDNDGTAGHVRVHAESDGTWAQVGADIDGEVAGDESGNSVSMSSDGTRVAIGARGYDNYRGYVRVYRVQELVSCDASTAPTNGAVGNCTNNLVSGSTCQPTCYSGYTVSGTSSCTAGTLTAATCTSSPSANTTSPPPPPSPSNATVILDDDDHAAGLAGILMVLLATTINMVFSL